MVTAALFFGTAAAALGVALGYRLGVAATVVTVLLSGGAPAALYVAWASYRLGAVQAGTQGGSRDIAHIADKLATAVGSQWRLEARVRRLHDPYPIPVRWEPADASLVDNWDALVAAALSGSGWPMPTPKTQWANGPSSLAGSGSDLASVIDQIPTGRLVVLGEPGSGKTMLMVRLVLDMLARRHAGGPVPVLLPIATWDPASEDFREWLISRLDIDYPALVESAVKGSTAASSSRALLDQGLIIPIIDGLDEIPDVVRGPAIAKINDAVQPGERIVLTSRTAHFRATVRPAEGIEITLRGAAAIELCSLDPTATTEYLRADAGGPSAEARWSPVIAAIDDHTLLAKVLSSPLMTSIRAFDLQSTAWRAGGHRSRSRQNCVSSQMRTPLGSTCSISL